MTSKELRELIISALVIAFGFGITIGGGYQAFSDLRTLGFLCLICLFGVSVGFVLHELGHRFVAKKFGCVAEYVMWPFGLALALISSLFGFIFAAPGAVKIYAQKDENGNFTLTPEKRGLISVAGPAINIVLSIIFALLNFIFPMLLFKLGSQVNAWLAIFNLIPFPPLDGADIFNWNKVVWIACLLAGGALFAAQYLLS
jgi:Zn-dependent protease